MNTFKQFLVEEDESSTKSILTQFQALPSKVGEVKSLIKQWGVETPEDLVKKLLETEEIQQVKELWQKSLSKGESAVIHESMMGMLAKGLEYILDAFFESVSEVLHLVFGPLAGEESTSSKIIYAAQLMVVFLSAPILIALASPEMGVAGATTAVAATAIPGLNIAWWVIEWFGNTFLKPVLKAAGDMV